jgi:hypothetical protein
LEPGLKKDYRTRQKCSIAAQGDAKPGDACIADVKEEWNTMLAHGIFTFFVLYDGLKTENDKVFNFAPHIVMR